MEVFTAEVSQETASSRIFDISGHWFEPEIAEELWQEIEEHKWFLSERVGRDVGIKVACIDFIENIDSIRRERADTERVRILQELGAKMADVDVWSTISDSQPPKQIVEKRILLPLVESELATKHGVTPPRTIIFFGPPGTGKTHFVRAIAGVLRWWFIEISPSSLTANGEDRLGANLKRVMEKVRGLDEAVIFIDEFEEIAASRDNASRLDKSITNEFLKQVPLIKRATGKLLLVCATNYIHQLDAALLRPGRFDCIIPVGGLDHDGRRTVFEHYLAKTNFGDVDVDGVVSLMPMFTPADMEFLFQKVTHTAFQKEYHQGTDYRITTGDFLEALHDVKPTLTEEVLAEFHEDCERYTRF